MEPSLTKLQLIYILVFFQTIFCNHTHNRTNMIRTLENTFGYEFSTFPELDEVLIWKISKNQKPFTPLQYNGENIQFQSDETYLLLAQSHWGVSWEIYTIIYYWLGRNTSLIDKKVAAKYAVILAQFINAVQRDHFKFQYVYLSREAEPTESNSFKNAVKRFNSIAESFSLDDSNEVHIDNHLNSPLPHLFVILGESHSRIKKVPLCVGLLWMRKSDSCLMLELGNIVEDMMPVYYFCGVETNIKQIYRCNRFAKWFLPIHNYHVRKISKSIKSKHVSDFKRFVEVLEDRSFYNPNEVDDSGDHLKNAAEFIISRDQNISLFNLTPDGIEINESRPICNFMFVEDYKINYLLDTKSVAGIFLIFDCDSENDMNRKVIEIQLAEEYLDQTYPQSSGQIMKMRILDGYEKSKVTDFKINYSDFPLSIPNMSAGILW